MASSDAEVVSRVRAAVRAALDDDFATFATDGYFRPRVVAVSGGADSLCLLDALVAVVPDPQKRLVVGHIDHQIRPGSVSDAEHVRRIASDLGVPFAVESVDVPALAKSERLGIEEAARLARYRALARFADASLTDTVVTGHTRDDSVETIVLHLLRGSGAHGLSGIGKKEWLSASWLGATDGRPIGLGIERPLLEVSRAETVAYCAARGIDYVTDESNVDPRFLRNRVRGHLLPVLRTYNPAIDRALLRVAAVLADEDALLDDRTFDAWDQLRQPGAPAESLSLASWSDLHRAIQRRLVRRIAANLHFEEIGYEAVERALAVGRSDGPPRAELGGGLIVERRRDTLVFMRERHDREGTT